MKMEKDEKKTKVMNYVRRTSFITHTSMPIERRKQRNKDVAEQKILVGYNKKIAQIRPI